MNIRLAGSENSSILALINGIEILIKLIRHKTRFYHGIVNLGIELKYVQKLLCAVVELLLIVHIFGVLIVRAYLGEPCKPVSVACLNTHSKQLYDTIYKGRIAEQKNLGKY